jgi:hypothetical protein
MNIRKNSWHYKLITFSEIPSTNLYFTDSCDYWATVIKKLMIALGIVLLVVMALRSIPLMIHYGLMHPVQAEELRGLGLASYIWGNFVVMSGLVFALIYLWAVLGEKIEKIQEIAGVLILAPFGFLFMLFSFLFNKLKDRICKPVTILGE